jgi:hypothetical protein
MNLYVILLGLRPLVQTELITPIKKAKLDTTSLALSVRPGGFELLTA